jgi:hypothetical protein
VIDTTAPAAPSVTPITTNDSSPLIGGSASLNPGESLSVTVNGVTYSDVSVVDGVWSLQLPTLTDGTYAVTATVADAAGNSSSDATSSELVVDSQAPVAPSVNPITTTDSSPLIGGTATLNPGESLSVTVNGVTYSNVPVVDGAWTLQLPVLTDGTYAVTATVTDAAGNSSSDSTSSELVVDAHDPAAPVITGISSDTGASGSDGITQDHTLLVNGTAEAGSTVEVFLDGESLGTVVADIQGHWTLDATGTILPEGSYTFTAIATDAAGNSSTSSEDLPIRIDNHAVINLDLPAESQLTDGAAQNVSLSGSVNGIEDGQTLTLTFSGPGGEVTVVVEVIDGTWTVNADLSPLGSGPVSLSIEGDDLAGNQVSATQENLFVISVVEPQVEPLVPDDGRNDPGGIDTLPPVTGNDSAILESLHPGSQKELEGGQFHLDDGRLWAIHSHGTQHPPRALFSTVPDGEYAMQNSSSRLNDGEYGMELSRLLWSRQTRAYQSDFELLSWEDVTRGLTGTHGADESLLTSLSDDRREHSATRTELR